jgi:hypothetical protein
MSKKKGKGKGVSVRQPEASPSKRRRRNTFSSQPILGAVSEEPGPETSGSRIVGVRSVDRPMQTQGEQLTPEDEPPFSIFVNGTDVY